MTRNWYAEAIMHLTKPVSNEVWFKVCVGVAQKHPKIFVEAFCRFAEVVEPWKSEVMAFCMNGKKIDAIKLWREKTGMGLQDAKHAVEEFCPEVKPE